MTEGRDGYAAGMTVTTLRRSVVALLLAAGLLSACGDDDGSASDTTLTSVPAVTTDTTDPETSDGAPAGTSDDEGDSSDTDGELARSFIRAFDGELVDGVWEIDDAGVVEFSVVDNGLELGEVVAYEDWEFRVTEEESDEIEVEFRRAEHRYAFEVEYDDGVLQIEQDLDIDPAEPGTFEIGPVGVATIAVEGGTVSLTDLEVVDEWDVAEREESDDEVEIELRRDNVKWSFEAELDNGRLEVQIDFEIEGRFP